MWRPFFVSRLVRKVSMQLHSMQPVVTLAAALLLASTGLAADELSISPINPKQLSYSKLQFMARLGELDVTKSVQWSSSNRQVANISGDGVATLAGGGTTTITAYLRDYQVSTALVVTSAMAPIFIVEPRDTDVSAVINRGSGVKVKLLDNLGEPLRNQTIGIAIGTNPPGSGRLTGVLRQTTDAGGVATFRDLTIDWLGNGYTLVASANPSSGPVSGTSAAFNELRVGDACLGPDMPACSSGCADTDLDGLNDAWERAGGVDLNGDGVITDSYHDVLLPGADPNRPDIYLKYDYMVAPTHSHQPPAKAWDQMRAMFAAHGIALHVTAPASGIAEHQVTTLDANAQPNCAGTDFVTMQQLRAQYFGNLRPAYHYLVFAHDSSTPGDGSLRMHCPTDALCGGQPLATATGIADVPGANAIVSFGHIVDSGATVSIELWASTMMHELGHNFGLVHGSLADPGDYVQECMNYKPNYISVMNYNYELNGLIPAIAPGSVTPIACSTDADCGPPKVPRGRCATPGSCFCTNDLGPGNNVCYRPDYAEDNLFNLNETTLDEKVGVGGPGWLEDIVWYYTRGGTLAGASNGSAIDWNNDGTIANLSGCTVGPGSSQCPDLNNDQIHSDLMDTTADWTQAGGRFIHLNFQFQCTAGYQNETPMSLASAPVAPGPAAEQPYIAHAFTAHDRDYGIGEDRIRVVQSPARRRSSWR
jgi:reprolysin-like metallo-peptidase family M12B